MVRFRYCNHLWVFSDRAKELNGVSKGASVENGTRLELSEEGNSSEEVSESGCAY